MTLQEAIDILQDVKTVSARHFPKFRVEVQILDRVLCTYRRPVGDLHCFGLQAQSRPLKYAACGPLGELEPTDDLHKLLGAVKADLIHAAKRQLQKTQEEVAAELADLEN